MKITTELCVARINEFKAAKWKRVSKKGDGAGGTIRVFEAPDAPGVRAVVLEKGGEIASVQFEGQQAAKPGSNYYFELDENNDEDKHAWFWVVNKKYWQRHKSHDDQGVDGGKTSTFEDEILPKGFSNAAESLFEFGDMTSSERTYKEREQEGIKRLLAAGFEPLPGSKLAKPTPPAKPGSYDVSEVAVDDEAFLVEVIGRGGGVSVLSKQEWENQLSENYDLATSDLESKKVKAGTRILVANTRAKAENLVVVKKDCKAMCQGFADGLTSDHWFVLVAGKSKVVSADNEPIDLKRGEADDFFDWTPEKWDALKEQYKADVILVHM